MKKKLFLNISINTYMYVFEGCCFHLEAGGFLLFLGSLLSLETIRKIFVQLVLGSLASLKDVYVLLSSILVATCKEYIIADVSAKN